MSFMARRLNRSRPEEGHLAVVFRGLSAGVKLSIALDAICSRNRYWLFSTAREGLSLGPESSG